MRNDMGRIGAVAALLGGCAWTLKGVWTLVTLDQPPLVYEVGPPLFLGAAWGLWSILPRETKGRAAARTALVAATVLFAIAAGVAVVAHLRPDSWGTLSSVASLVAMVGFLFALAWIGLLVRRTRSLPPTHGLPLGLAAALLPLLFLFGVGGIMIGGQWSDRLIEVPIVLWGIGWMWVGRTLWRQASLRVTNPASRNRATQS